MTSFKKFSVVLKSVRQYVSRKAWAHGPEDKILASDPPPQQDGGTRTSVFVRNLGTGPTQVESPTTVFATHSPAKE